MIVVSAGCGKVIVCVCPTTVATCTAAPLLTPLVVTEAFKVPALNPASEVTVSCVLVAAVTVPVAPPEKLTKLLPGVVENPKPLIVIDVAVVRRFAVFTEIGRAHV